MMLFISGPESHFSGATSCDRTHKTSSSAHSIVSLHYHLWLHQVVDWHEPGIYIILCNFSYLKYMKYFPFVTKEKYSKIHRSKSLQGLDLGQNFRRFAEQYKSYQKCVEPYTTPQQNLQDSIAFL